MNDGANAEVDPRRRSSLRVVATVILASPPIHLHELSEIAVYEQCWIRNLKRQLLKIPYFKENEGWYCCLQPEELLWPQGAADECDARIFSKVCDDVEKRRLHKERQHANDEDEEFLSESPQTQPEEHRGASDFEDYQHLVDEVYNPPIVDRPTKTVDPNIVRLIKDRGVPAHTLLQEKFAICMQQVGEIREDLSLIQRLSDNNNVPYETPNAFLESHQKRMDDAINSFIDTVTSQTGYKPPPVRCTCPICLDIVRDAVCIDCGHVACHECLSDPLVPRHGDMVKCPLCSKLGRWRKLYLA